MRTFDSGATRDNADDKPHYVAYLSPQVLERFGEYMLEHETQADGTKREAGNWKRGISRDVYLDSLMRHVITLWAEHEDPVSMPGHGLLVEDTACAIMFNVMGYLHEHLKAAQ